MTTRRRVVTATTFICLILLGNVRTFSISSSQLDDEENAYDGAPNDLEAARRLVHIGAAKPYDDEQQWKVESPESSESDYKNYIRNLLAIYSMTDKQGFRRQDRYNNGKDADVNDDQSDVDDDLDSIFDAADEVDDDVPSSISSKTEVRKKKLPSNYIDITGLNKDDMKILIKQVDKMKKMRSRKYRNSTANVDKDHSVADAELDTIFADSEVNEDRENANRDKNRFDIDAVNDLPSYDRVFNENDISQTEKKKRSVDGLDNIIKTATDSNILEKLFEIVAKLRLKERLENKEISILADSLNDATNFQVKKSLVKLKDELTALEKAIMIEKALERADSTLSDQEEKYLDILTDAYLQDVSRGDDDKHQGGMKDSSNDADSVDDTSRDNTELWNTYISQSGGNKMEKTDQNDDSLLDFASNKALSEINVRKKEALPLHTNNEIEVEDDDDDDDDESDEFDENDENKEVNDRRISLSPDAYKGLKQLFRDVDLEEIRRWKGATRYHNVCPEIERLTDNCAMARDVGVSLDDQARELCSRHQACYTCAASLGKSPEHCDDGYTAEAARMCEGNEKCAISAESFLHLSRYYHRVASRPQSSCLAGCVVDFIYGISRRK